VSLPYKTIFNLMLSIFWCKWTEWFTKENRNYENKRIYLYKIKVQIYLKAF